VAGGAVGVVGSGGRRRDWRVGLLGDYLVLGRFIAAGVAFVSVGAVFVPGVAFILAVDTAGVGLFGVFDLVGLLFGEAGELFGVTGAFVALGVFFFGRFARGDLCLEERSDNVGANAAHAGGPSAIHDGLQPGMLAVIVLGRGQA